MQFLSRVNTKLYSEYKKALRDLFDKKEADPNSLKIPFDRAYHEANVKNAYCAYVIQEGLSTADYHIDNYIKRYVAHSLPEDVVITSFNSYIIAGISGIYRCSGWMQKVTGEYERLLILKNSILSKAQIAKDFIESKGFSPSSCDIIDGRVIEGNSVFVSGGRSREDYKPKLIDTGITETEWYNYINSL